MRLPERNYVEVLVFFKKRSHVKCFTLELFVIKHSFNDFYLIAARSPVDYTPTER